MIRFIIAWRYFQFLTGVYRAKSYQPRNIDRSFQGKCKQEEVVCLYKCSAIREFWGSTHRTEDNSILWRSLKDIHLAVLMSAAHCYSVLITMHIYSFLVQYILKSFQVLYWKNQLIDCQCFNRASLRLKSIQDLQQILQEKIIHWLTHPIISKLSLSLKHAEGKNLLLLVAQVAFVHCTFAQQFDKLCTTKNVCHSWSDLLCL